MRFLQRHCRCFRHIPHPADILPEHAALVEIVLDDANGKTVVGPNGVEARITEDGAEVPIHIPSIIPVIRGGRPASLASHSPATEHQSPPSCLVTGSVCGRARGWTPQGSIDPRVWPCEGTRGAQQERGHAVHAHVSAGREHGRPARTW